MGSSERLDRSWYVRATSMIFQRVLKGIPAAKGQAPGMTDKSANHAVAGGGIICNWWQNKPGGTISPQEIQAKLSERALYDHLVRYEDVSTETPFLSTTAGTVEREAVAERNVFFPPMYTALRFGTRNFSQDGYIVHAYLYTLGKKSVELEEFAEEVRDANTYTAFYAWHPEGEIVAKIMIPARRIERIERYDIKGLLSQLEKGQLPAPAAVFSEPAVYRDPLQYANVRGFPGIA